MKKLSLLVSVWLLVPFLVVRAQNSIEFRVSPNISAKPEIVNPSPAKITSPVQLGYDLGANYSYKLNPKWSIGAGVALGKIVYDMNFIAPSTAFGTKQDKGDTYWTHYFDRYTYQSLTANVGRHFALNGRTSIRILAEPSLRYYSYSADNYDGFQVGFNRAVRFDPDVPSTLPADLLVDIPETGHRLDLNIASSIGIERKLGSGSSLVFGVRKSFGLKPIGAGLLQVQMNDQLYTGEFNTRPGFFGLDLIYKYSFTKPSEAQKIGQALPSTDKHRKVVFAELVGNGIGFSANFDTRLKPGRNDGWGIRGGVGLIPDSYADDYLTLPVGVNYIIGKRKHGLEIGLGITPLYNLSGDDNFFIDLEPGEARPKLTSVSALSVGYRFQAANGLMYRVSNSFMYVGKGYFYPPIWPGISVGYSFNKKSFKLPPKEKKEKEDIVKPPPGKYRKTIYVEAAGNGFGLSGNFDMRLRAGRNDGPGFRVGVGYGGMTPDFADPGYQMTVPLAYNYIFLNERSGIETGLGVTPSFLINKTSQGRDLDLAAVFNLGYRLQPLREGLSLRAMWTPNYAEGKVENWAGFSIGYSFR